MLKRNGLKTCLMMLSLMSLATAGMFAESSTRECAECEKKDALLDEAETVIIELMEENAELQIELADSWKSCETIVEATATEAVAVAVKPLLIKVAGLKAQLSAVERTRIWCAVGGAGVGVVLGVVGLHLLDRWINQFHPRSYPDSGYILKHRSRLPELIYIW